ncbi:MAG: class I SAM-dependent methyltransferase [Erysipelotrichaceae bacterium]|nr:class I SAM-dependent methyltransferase [Erysipelotrichaceae bacterium]
MIKKEDVIEFFDELSADWDKDLKHNDEIINIILDNANIKEGIDVLDVACGTGVLFNDYLNRNVNSLTGVDISSGMIEVAKQKFNDERIKLVCTDVEDLSEEGKYDVVMIYNAFPHFINPQSLIKKCASLLKENGTLSIAHGMSRAKIDAHHHGPASKVSNGLMEAEDLLKLFEPYFEVKTVISNDEMYQVSGIKK